MRLFHKLYAWWKNYFWKPCMRCGKYYGGHEIDPQKTAFVYKTSMSDTGFCLCPKCSKELMEKNNGWKWYDYDFNPMSIYVKPFEQ